MGELIRKQDVLELPRNKERNFRGEVVEETIDVELIKALPAVQPKRGKWKDGKCDQCSGSAPFWPLATTYYYSNFCPHCGADMRGNEDGTDL